MTALQYFSSMPDFITDVDYYGNAETEIVRFHIDINNSLIIETITDKTIVVPSRKWTKKWSIIGAGKIKCSLTVGGREISWQIRVYPNHDNPINEMRWLEGVNGTFNMPTREFSSMFPEDDNHISDGD